jgi:hypothetical protein
MHAAASAQSAAPFWQNRAIRDNSSNFNNSADRACGTAKWQIEPIWITAMISTKDVGTMQTLPHESSE